MPEWTTTYLWSQAQATLAAAESNLVESLYQYNLSKLALARAAGIIETQYRDYLGRIGAEAAQNGPSTH